jgi:hypothetical protein
MSELLKWDGGRMYGEAVARARVDQSREHGVPQLPPLPTVCPSSNQDGFLSSVMRSSPTGNIDSIDTLPQEAKPWRQVRVSTRSRRVIWLNSIHSPLSAPLPLDMLPMCVSTWYFAGYTTDITIIDQSTHYERVIQLCFVRA